MEELTPSEAIIYLAENITPPVPKGLQEAKYAAQGKRDYEVGVSSVLKMIERHDPERKILDAQVVITKK